VNTLEDLLTEPHLAAVGLFEGRDHPSEGRLLGARSPFRVTGAAQHADRPAPELGSDGATILREAGFSDVEIADFAARGVVGGI
jgi:formyl-CoA transferase